VIRADGAVVDVALVHRRLSILDHAGGHQPMVHDGERLRPDLTYSAGESPVLAHEREPGAERLAAVAFNGCIYSHRAVRAQLESLGHRFGTDHSDTEVLVHGWRAWGRALGDELDGMYAAVIWDRTLGALSFGRDITGEKPLYRSDGDGLFVLCSSAAGVAGVDGVARSVLRTRGARVRVRADALRSWVRFGAGPTPPMSVDRTEAGAWRSVGVATGEAAEVHRAWAMPRRGGAGARFADDEASARLLERAVASRLEADVPMGVFLSGGLDSAVVAALAHRHSPDLVAFTVRMPEAAYDESEAASDTARAIGMRHTVLECRASAAEDLVMLVERLGLPFGDSSLLPTFWVSTAARERVKVALSGDGADELFGGYRRQAVLPTLERWRRVLALIPSGIVDRRDPRGLASMLARLGVAARHGGYDELVSVFATPDLRRVLRGASDRGSSRETGVDPLRHDFERYLPDDLLVKTDTASMAAGLEVRAPFLAREVVETALRTPVEVLMPGGRRKGLLRMIARRFVPAAVLDRPKRGFAIPIGAWLRDDFGGLRTLMLDHLLSADPFPGLGDDPDGIGVEIDGRAVRRMLGEHDAAGAKSISPWHGRDHGQRLYVLLVLSIWCRWLERVRRNGERETD
jgi:asparagine synthase (glutamine-hydrolysing)